jgi:hypothetical protein
MRRLAVAIVFAAVALAGRDAAAQDVGRVGLTMGYPSAFGIIWHISDRIAIRPALSLARASNENEEEVESTILGTIVRETSARTEADSSSIGVDVSALIYVSEWDNVRAYIAPAYSYSHTSTELELSLSGPPGVPASASFDTTVNTHGLRGTVGVQFTPHRRFAIYGETGIEYQSSETDFEDGLLSSVVRRDTSGNTLGTRSGVGVIFYF